MPEPSMSELTTLTLTRRERATVAHALTVTAALVDGMGDDAKDLLELYLRIQPDDLGPDTGLTCIGCEITERDSTRFVRVLPGCPVHGADE